MCLISNNSRSIREVFPDLSHGRYRITSRATATYNSVAWAISEQETDCCWWPVPYGEAEYPWPAERVETLTAFITVYKSVGYEVCDSESPEIGIEKVAIYVDKNGTPTHVARQLFKKSENRWTWTSKVIDLEDIEHETLTALDQAFGSVAVILERPYLETI